MFFGSLPSVMAVPTITVDDNYDPSTPGWDVTAFDTIQEGVDAALPGEEVFVYSGTYAEQVHIASSITLSGEDKLTTVIQAPALMNPDCTSPLLTNHPIICVDSNAAPLIQGFTVDGSFSATTHFRLMGIAIRQAGGTIQGNIIKNLCFETDVDPLCDPNGADEGVGIYVFNTDTTVRSVSILNNSINNFNKNGITVSTSQNSGNPTTFTISGNTIEGILGESGVYTSTVAQNGIQVQVPSGGGIIQNNTISNIVYNNAPTLLDPDKLPLVAVGILSISTPVDTLDNVILNSQVGILYFNDLNDLGTAREITGNNIQVIKPGTANNPGRNVYGVLVTDRSKDVLSPFDPPALSPLNEVLMGTPLSVAVKNNTISYVGTLPNTNTFGIEVDAGVGTSTVLGDNVLSMDIAQNRVGGVGNGFDVGLLLYQCDPANPPVGIIACGAGSLDTSRVVGNDINGNNYGVIFQGPIGQSLLDDFHHNRIAGNSVGVQNNTGLGILAINNWWGCNGGPGTAGCDTMAGNLPDYAGPWLVLSTVASPTAVLVGGASTLTADLKWNSNADNTSLLGFYVRDGIPVTFSVATLGSVFPLNVGTLSGAAPTTFTAPFVGGTFQVCATVDSETVCSDVTVEPPLMIFLPIVSR